MKDELTLTVGRRGAQLLFEQLRRAVFQLQGEDRAYLLGVLKKLHDYLDKPPTKYIQLEVLSVTSTPPDEG